MQIGAGASGKVYLAHDTFAHREVAVKLIDQSTLNDPEFTEASLKQLITEISLAGKLEHPHIVAILDASIADDSGYVAMEYVPGGNLARFTDPANLLPIETILQIIFKCCGALDYAYRQGVIHRDIKPENLMLVSGTDVKIADFGSSIFYQSQITQKVVVGSPAYMSLEQITGERLTFASDMYSLGVVTYQLLTGTLPFRANRMTELFDAIAHHQPDTPGTIRQGISPKLDRIIMRMIAKNPVDRYSCWAELALDLADAGRFSSLHQPINDSDKFTMLRKNDELSLLTDPDLWELIHASKWTRIPSRTVMMKEGDPAYSMYILAEGSIKVTKNGYLLNMIKPAEHFGEMSYIKRGTSRHATLETMSDCIVAEFQFDALDCLSKGCQLRLSRILLSAMTNRVALADDRIVQMYG